MSRTSEIPIQADTGAAASMELRYRRIVVKAGTSVLTAAPAHRGLSQDAMADLVRQICQLRLLSAEVLLVTSGAIAAGEEVLGPGREELDRDIPSRQVLAAVGQSRLMHTYQELFFSHGYQVAQTLLTINDIADRQSYLNVRTTLLALLELGVVPILNENDVVAVDEIGEVFGDNDRLSALVANLIDADLLVILTDTEGLYTADPNVDSSARLISQVDQVDDAVEAMAGKDLNPWARGGMATKIEAARLVTTAGVTMSCATDCLKTPSCGRPEANPSARCSCLPVRNWRPESAGCWAVFPNELASSWIQAPQVPCGRTTAAFCRLESAAWRESS